MGNNFLRAGLPRVLCLEHDVQFFKGATLCLDKEEVDNRKFKTVPKRKKSVAVMCQLYNSLSWAHLCGVHIQPDNDVLHRDGSGKGVNKSSAAGANGGYHHSIGTHVI